MRQPIGLYLTDFGLDGAVAPALPDLAGLPRFEAFGAVSLDGPAALDDAPAPSADDMAPDLLPALPPPAEAPPPEPDSAALLEAMQLEHEAALVAARRHWAAEQGGALAGQIAEAFATLETRLSDTLAMLLEPFLAKAAQVAALERLRGTLATLLRDAGQQTVTVSGPADLVDVIRASYGERPGLVFTESDAPDVTIALGETRIRSQLGDWARRLEAMLGDAA